MVDKAHVIATHPDFPWLEAGDAAGVGGLLASLGFLAADEQVESCARAGEGNMNLTLRVVTDRRRFILKQSRPWVEKYDQIAAPWDRVVYEQRFYAAASDWPQVAGRMPALMGFDESARVMMLEDLGEASDFTWLYQPEKSVPEGVVDQLAKWLRALHDRSAAAADIDRPARFANRAMRELNHEHVYRFPLQDDNGLLLDDFEPGLARAAEKLQRDAAYIQRVHEIGDWYLADGDTLLHGDFFPGSWLETDDGIRVIDPEFCYFGDREFDVAVALAHAALAQRRGMSEAMLAAYGSDALNHAKLARYAAAEVMRRLIGVAQLPLPRPDGWRAALLDRAYRTMMSDQLEDLW